MFKWREPNARNNREIISKKAYNRGYLEIMQLFEEPGWVNKICSLHSQTTFGQVAQQLDLFCLLNFWYHNYFRRETFRHSRKRKYFVWLIVSWQQHIMNWVISFTWRRHIRICLHAMARVNANFIYVNHFVSRSAVSRPWALNIRHISATRRGDQSGCKRFCHDPSARNRWEPAERYHSLLIAANSQVYFHWNMLMRVLANFLMNYRIFFPCLTGYN